MFPFFAALELSHAITVKPANKQPIIENSHVDAKKNPQSKYTKTDIASHSDVHPKCDACLRLKITKTDIKNVTQTKESVTF